MTDIVLKDLDLKTQYDFLAALLVASVDKLPYGEEARLHRNDLINIFKIILELPESSYKNLFTLFSTARVPALEEKRKRDASKAAEESKKEATDGK